MRLITIKSFLVLIETQGLVRNGAKVYVTGLATDPIQHAVHELNELGKASGGIAKG